ncbi:MAG: DUF4118 domain-containing protein [Chloroflexi bacterium]|nr:DUF4118 domain-containing protein [Chloroflexota bacterium]
MLGRLPARVPQTVFAVRYGLLFSGGTLGLLTVALAPVLDERHIADVSLLYLLLTLVAAGIWGYRVGLFAAVAADLLVNFFFIPPLHTFTVQEPTNVVALAIFLAVAVVGATMLALLRRQVFIAEARRAEAATLLGLTQQMAHAASPRIALDRLCFATARALNAKAAAILVEEGNWRILATTGASNVDVPRDEEALASQAAARGEVVRFGAAAHSVRRRGNSPGADARLYLPLRATRGVRAVLRISGPIKPPPLVDAEHILEAFATEASLAIERERLAEEVRLAESLRRADEFKSVLLSSVSHDLRSPLTAIKAAVGSLREQGIEWSDEDRASFLATIESQTDRLTSTVSNLLEMSRLEGGAVRPHLESIEAALLLEEAAQATAATTTGHPIERHAPDGLWLRADYGFALQSLTNLVENAAKYSKPGGRIVLEAGSERHRAVLRVADEGPGIPPADVPHVFEKFYRGTGAAKSRGTGLGLAIVRAMVELCGGHVEVQSSDAGTVFTIDLPLAAGPAR